MLEPVSYLRFVLAFAVVLALIAGLAWLLRRVGFGPVAGAGKGRIAVVDTAAIDPRRRLVLLRRDGVEHLLLLSPTSELVIETGIKPAARRPAPLTQAQPAEPGGA